MINLKTPNGLDAQVPELDKEDVSPKFNLEQLNEVNTDNVSPMTSVIDMSMPSRIDEVDDGDDAERVLQNAPVRPDDGRNFYTVPKVIE